MRSQKGTAPGLVESEFDGKALVKCAAALLLRVAHHEHDGLTRRCAVLAAGSELGVDPAAIIRHTREVAE